MASTRPIRIGLMGFGQTGRQIYELAANSDDIEIVAIADIGEPKILHYLLQSELPRETAQCHQLEGNFLVNPNFKSRMMPIDRPAEMPWDIFDVDVVIDATGKYRDAETMRLHLRNGAQRVILRTLPDDHIDRIVIPGVNDGEIQRGDALISAGSATSSALYLLLKILSDNFEIECANMTSIHAYTGDQALQDYAGSDFRRSRSAAENIIPNTHEAHRWLGKVLPQFEGKILTYVLNVPIQEGCLLDVSMVLKDAKIDAEHINQVMRDAVPRYPGIIDVAEDPIVSSDVIGSTLSLLFDIKGTIKAGEHIAKALCWYENRGHAARILDVVRLYARLDSQQEVA